MAEIIIKKWQCDWCKDIYEKRPELPYPRCTISYTYTWDWTEEGRSLKDICPSCNRKLRALIDENFNGQS